MPELPEVETVRRQLATYVVGKTIAAVQEQRKGIVRGDVRILENALVENIRRFGKLLVIDCNTPTGAWSLAVHLKMTGRLSYFSSEPEPIAHTHVTFQFTDSSSLSFADARRFGYLTIMQTDAVLTLPFVAHLGKEPLKDLRLDDLRALVAKTLRPIKQLLLDQTRIAGIGNIYACEALFRARLSPFRPAASLATEETQALFIAIEAVLTEGIARGGASDHTYRDVLGNKGQFQDFFRVYGRTGQPCPSCSTPIHRDVIGGRGTWWCRRCQL